MPPRIYKGNSDDVVKIDKADGPAVMEFNCPKCSSNTVVQTDGADFVVVNTVGAYDGKLLLDGQTGSVTTQLTIKADHPWTATIGGLDLAQRPAPNASVSGEGDDVVLLSGTSDSAAVSNQGTSNFAFKYTLADGSDSGLPINTIGKYKGIVHITEPSVVQVTSDGTWAIAPQ